MAYIGVMVRSRVLKGAMAIVPRPLAQMKGTLRVET